jgi:hypothetical protein
MITFNAGISPRSPVRSRAWPDNRIEASPVAAEHFDRSLNRQALPMKRGRGVGEYEQLH